jgi:hypothetical protein
VVNHIPWGQASLLGQRQLSPEQIILEAYQNLYFALVPVVAGNLLERQTIDDPILNCTPDSELPDRIAEKAEAIAKAAMLRLGVNIK